MYESSSLVWDVFVYPKVKKCFNTPEIGVLFFACVSSCLSFWRGGGALRFPSVDHVELVVSVDLSVEETPPYVHEGDLYHNVSSIIMKDKKRKYVAGKEKRIPQSPPASSPNAC